MFERDLIKHMPDYAMKGGNSDKLSVSAFSLSLLFRLFPDRLQKMVL